MDSEDSDNFAIETQIGANNVDTRDIDLGNETEFIEFELEPAPVFKQLATGIYESDSAGLREPLLNAITAVLEAQREYDLDPQNGIVEVKVQCGGGNETLIIQDNGVGITEERLKKVMAIIGKSLNRDNPNLAGKFGIGFLALWMLVGLNGGFEMYSRSRRNSQQITGIWKSGGFVWDKSEEMQKLDADQYGTRFEVPLREELSVSDIREWVDELAEYSRVSVKYEEIGPDSNTVFEEDYGISSLEDKLPTYSPKLVIDTEYYKIVTGKESNGETILLDVPIERNTDYISGLPFYNFDIRLKKENSVVVSGPHEGQMVVTENEYTQLSKNRKKSYISRSQLTEGDVVLPSPIGTRDILTENDKFWEYIMDKINTVYQNKIEQLYREIGEFSDFFTLGLQDQQLLLHSFMHLKDYNSSLTESVNDKLDISIQSSLGRKFELLAKEVEYAPRKAEGISKKSNRKETTVWEIEKKRRDSETGVVEGEVYMGVTLNQDKAEVVWEDNGDSQVARVPSTNEYGDFETELNWKKLKNISKDNISNFNVPTYVREKFTQETETTQRQPIEEHTLTVHTKENSKTTVDIKVNQIKKASEKVESTSRLNLGKINPYYIIIFPTNTEFKISNNYHLADESIGLTNCTKTEFEYLKDCNRVFTLSEFITKAEQKEVITSNGQIAMKDLPDNSIFHIVTGYEELFKTEAFMPHFEQYLTDYVLTGDSFFVPDRDTVTYVPLTTKELATVRPFITEDTVIVNGEHRYQSVGNIVTIENNTRMYAFARLNNWQNTTEMDVLKTIDTKLTEKGYDFVETLGELHDMGKSPNSITKNT